MQKQLHCLNKLNRCKKTKKTALRQVENLTVLTQSSSDNIKTVISQLSEKRQVY